MLKEQKH